jgi:copper chaperone CopZ
MRFFLLLISVVLTFGFSQEMSAQSKKGKETVTFNISMDCHSCEKKIKDNMRFEKGVTGIKTDLNAQTVQITYKADKTNEENLSAALTKLGYKPIEEKSVSASESE